MDKNEVPEPLIDATPVSKYLGVAKSTVYDQVAKGILPHVCLWKGTRRSVIRFRMSDIEKFLRDRSIGARPAPAGGEKSR
jgi:excisionase family DNA binding protein